MHYVLLLIVLVMMALYVPHLFKVVELLVLAPIIGVAFGGFAWAVSAMICSTLITWAAFGTFLAGGTLVTMAFIAKAS